MYMAIAITGIGIGIVVMVGYLVLGQVRGALPTNTAATWVPNDVYGTWDGVTPIQPTACVETFNTSAANTSALLQCTDARIGLGQTSVMTTAFAGLGLIAVGIIVLAAFGLVQVFQ